MSGRPADTAPEEGAQAKGERRVFTLTLMIMKNALRATVIVASACVFSMHAGISHADSLTLSDIRTRCSEPEGSEAFAFCRGYVAALVEGVIVKHYPDCIPPMVNDYQFALLMRKYLNANPESLHLPAVDGVLSAIAEMFKCKN
jgi:Rap1a immunity proteins